MNNPERTLWLAVLDQALSDAYGTSAGRGVGGELSAVLKQHARAWFWGNGDDFKQVCDLAGIDPQTIRHKAIALMNGDTQYQRTRYILGRDLVA